MASAVIYLDESGDLGWNFNAPYRQGGSSRYLTISALIVPSEKTHHPKRLIKDLYASRGWSRANEKKWAEMSDSAKLEFANKSVSLKAKHSDIKFFAITVKKENVWAHIRTDANKLYNYMIKLCLIDQMATYEYVTLVPDPRSIKVASGNSLHDYLQTELWLEKKVPTILKTSPVDSMACLGLQFADMLAGAVFKHYEDNESAAQNLLARHVTTKRLFF